MQFQCFQIRLKSQESCKFVNIVLGAALREIAVDKFSQLEPIESKRQHDMSRRLNTDTRLLYFGTVTFIGNHHQFFQVYAHVHCRCETCDVFIGEV